MRQGLLLVVLATVLVLARAATQQCTSWENVVIGGSDLQHAELVASPGQCCDLCYANADCTIYTWNATSKTCILKNKQSDSTSAYGVTSGTTNDRTIWSPCMGASSSYPFCDTKLSVDDRLKDLVSRVSTADAATQLRARESAQIDNIGLPAYYWGTNAIHGMQNTACLADGQCPTSFPAPNGLSATFNYSLVKDMGRIIGRELRAYYNTKFHNGLDTWSPTINPSRDPRWGRNVESPGESPFVCGQYGAAYTEGLQNGDDKDYTQAVVTLKHWVAYSVEDYDNVTRYEYNAIVSEYDLMDTYFPGWEYVVKNAKPLGVMCSYNSLNGVPTCGNPALTAYLREDWGFEGYITSDSDSIHCIWADHHYESNAVLATRDGLLGGCDIDSGDTYADNLEAAVNQSLVNRSAVDAALTNSYRMRFNLGLFDPNVTNAYDRISADEVGMSSSQETSLLAARKSMTLLKNDGQTLPFATGKKVAVIGKSSNSAEDILGNYVGPICPSGAFDCVQTLYQGVAAANQGGATTLSDDVADINTAIQLAMDADQVVLTISNYGQAGEGKDRTYIGLDTDQQELVAAVLKVGKPTAIVMLNGGLISLDWIKDEAQAILVAFAPGVHGGQAVAETIFGANNPGGKLPVTMYASDYVNDVDFLNMSMQAVAVLHLMNVNGERDDTGPGRSYKYYTGEPLYPFAYGLSYTTFNLSWSPAPPMTTFTSTLRSTTYTATVTNTGSVGGDEVVFAFYKPKSESLKTLPVGNPVPIKEIFGFQRVALGPGQSTQVTFELNAETLAQVTLDGHRELHSGEFEIELTRGHGEVLTGTAVVDVAQPERLATFRKWW
ncbi:uncharacterized protein MONBRDRAFT_39142 [Monosiga brevicollis MX1]|uniref:Apple domain-containing protein n=1 Tax=Monosiga brevicollis TaxID=81824 RepID=A9VCI2_MONBE|nr:uncharacterized protein MONBRDRAFT_39142 [Monosiga brevicollis MX1]EDQ84789.1 predicted protein [Monosiga brevicollis MX1]|eukprot:XP_001750439.1 hypothetical protein [Monosiga brevicollis MX1]